MTELRFNFFKFRYRFKCTNVGGGFTGVDEDGTIGSGGDMLGVGESATAKDMV